MTDSIVPTVTDSLTIYGVHRDRGGMALSSSSVTLGDGSLWWHAAHLGAFRRGDESFEITPEVVRNFVRVFSTGYPRKVPLDYDHGSTNGVADGSRGVPKAGDVVEMKAVLEESDLTPAIKTQIERANEEQAALNRDPIAPWGLWVRVRPTAKALGYVRAREYTELSIAFADDVEHNETGEHQGPTILAVALTNTPFLHNMIPVAASRGTGSGSTSQEPRMADQNPTRVFSLMTARAGRTISSDVEAEQFLADQHRELGRLAPLADIGSKVRHALGMAEGTGDQVVARITELRTEAETARVAREAAENARIDAEADGILRELEAHLTPTLKESFKPMLVTELKAGGKKGSTKIEGAIKQLEKRSSTNAAASGGSAASDADPDSRLAERTEQILTSDPEIKQLAATDPRRARTEAHKKARREIMSVGAGDNGTVRTGT